MPSRRRYERKHKGRNLAIALVILGVVVVLGAFVMSAGFSASRGPASTGDPRLAYLSITQSTPILGLKDAKVTIFELGDFQCTYCDQWFKTQEPLVVQGLLNTGQAKLAWKDFDYYGPESTYASQAAYAAGEQGKFWQFHDSLYSHQQAPNSGWASKANLVTFAQDLGLNMTDFNRSFNSGKYDSLIKGNFGDGQQLGVNGTPAFFVVGPTGKIVQIVGAQPYSVFVSAVASVAGP